MTNPKHTDTSRSGDLVEPLFSCSQDGCREERSYPADMLALHNGAPICEDCYHDLPFKSQTPDPDDDQETPVWHDLPRFVPSFTRRIEALEAENKRLREVVKHYGDTLCEGIGECVGDFCGKLSSDECAGCFARAELERIADE